MGCRPAQVADADHADTFYSLRTLARIHRDLTTEIDEQTARIGTRLAAANPGLLAIKGVGPVIGAQLLLTAGDNLERLRSGASFAALCGTAPFPVSSGGTDRHRLSRAAGTGRRAAPCT